MWQPRFEASPPSNARGQSHSVAFSAAAHDFRRASAAETLREVPVDTATPPRARWSPGSQGHEPSDDYSLASRSPASQHRRAETPDAAYVQRLEQQLRDLERYNAKGAHQVRAAGAPLWRRWWRARCFLLGRTTLRRSGAAESAPDLVMQTTMT